MFEIGKNYKSKINGKVYKCRRSVDGYARLYYDHKGVEYSICVSPGFVEGLGLRIETFEVVDEQS
jgi:hypothetical protein